MHTKGLADESIGRLYEGARLADALRDARARTLAVYDHLDLSALAVPCLHTVNPPLWELAHIAWFQERWCQRYSPETGTVRRASSLARADDLLDSSSVPHDSRWTLDYPPERELRAYMERTLDATLAALQATPPERRYFFALALLHEDMHAEALLMTLQTLGLPAPAIARDPPRGAPASRDDVAFAEGVFARGTAREETGFVFDNEKWASAVAVQPFRMGRNPVTQGEFLEFVEDGGSVPRYWQRLDGQWLVRCFDRWLVLDPHVPMVHVSLPEAEGFCRWAGRRLPTENEWEYAARNAGRPDRYPWGDEHLEHGEALDYRHGAPSLSLADPKASRSGLRQMLGGVWEWTSSPFAPYPGFRADPYHDYSQPWFATHYVLRGGSFATRSRLVHNRFRNFYLPDRGDVFAGFRTCAVD